MNEFVKKIMILGCELEKAETDIEANMIINDAEILYRKEIEALNLPRVIDSTITAKQAALEIFEWIQSDDCWITDKDGKRLPDAILDGKDLSKMLEKYYL